MIPITTEQVCAYCKAQVYETALNMAEDWGETLKLNDVDDLHDVTIEHIMVERVYQALYAMLPVVFDEVDLYNDELRDELIDDDVWGTYSMREGIGLCD